MFLIKVWVLYADIVCINYDGSILDACLLALIIAITSMKPMRYRLDEKNCVHYQNTEEMTDENIIELNLKLEYLIFGTTFCIYDGYFAYEN